MKLPRGATGFDAPAVDGPAVLRDFTVLCHHAARAIGGAVVGITPAGVTPNFHTGEIRRRADRIAALRHVAVPLVAFALTRAEGLTFVDHPGLTAGIAEVSDLEVIAAASLAMEVARADLGALGPAEHKQIACWQPATVGELLFNFWD